MAQRLRGVENSDFTESHMLMLVMMMIMMMMMIIESATYRNSVISRISGSQVLGWSGAQRSVHQRNHYVFRC